VILNHTNATMGNLATFTEVLTHEIGHALGLRHSSELNPESDPCLKEATMYYLAHADGRGATLGDWDKDVSVRLHPPTNTPPWSYDRVMDIVTQPIGAPNVPGINEIELRGYDLQSAPLTLATANATGGAGSFSQAGSLLKFTPNGYYGGIPRLDPASMSFYEHVYARFSDGVHASPYVWIRVVSLNDDSKPYPEPSDGLPDEWMLACFGHIDPRANDLSRAGDDKDGDGLSNLTEFRIGTNPTNGSSNLRITGISPGTLQWFAKAYELYEVQTSTNLPHWTGPVYPVLPTNAPLAVRTNLLATNIIATISNLPLTSPRTFFRVRKVP
jgi:hypothetical protein